MKSTLKYLSILALVAGQACTTDPSSAPADASVQSALATSGFGARRVTVYTQNMYVGADVDAVIAALASPDPTDDVPALMAAIATLQHTDYPARAKGIANEIARKRPQIVGLQEVSTIDVEIPPLGASVHTDFLATLLDDLHARGLEYVVAASHTNFTATPAEGVSLVDRDVMLVDASRVNVTSSAGHQFTDNLGVVAPGVDLERGWVQITAEIDGTAYAIASLHTEGSGPPEITIPLHASQVADVVGAMGTLSPAIVIGDFNSDPGDPAIGVIESGGFTDTWAALHPGAKGLTCCEQPDLSNVPNSFTDRIDYVFTRGFGEAQGADPLRGQIDLVDAGGLDRVRNADGQWIWLSDHAGLVANLLLPRVHHP
ncbi:MAG TPA: endonuclease/exonuclease/phosphatase family protein [Dongiaceae bacterium]|nr:endonuclease/exonuclease/phosphatase family protein [Dongiaceae bacterium]